MDNCLAKERENEINNGRIFLSDLRDIKDRYSWISPDEITLTEKISKTVTGEVR